MTPPVRSLLIFAAGHAAACALVWLVVVGFFDAWDGRVVSVRSADPEQRMARVLVVEPGPAGDVRREVDWPATALEGLSLPIDARALPLPSDFSDRPVTTKRRFQLGFVVSPAGGGARWVPTPTPQSFGLAVLLFALGIGIRNMVVAGSPLALARPTPVEGPSPRAVPSPAPAAPRGPRSQPGPPPARPRRGVGRRR